MNVIFLRMLYEIVINIYILHAGDDLVFEILQEQQWLLYGRGRQTVYYTTIHILFKFAAYDLHNNSESVDVFHIVYAIIRSLQNIFFYSEFDSHWVPFLCSLIQIIQYYKDKTQLLDFDLYLYKINLGEIFLFVKTINSFVFRVIKLL